MASETYAKNRLYHFLLHALFPENPIFITLYFIQNPFMSGAPISSHQKSSGFCSFRPFFHHQLNPHISSAFSDFLCVFLALTHQYTICIIESDNTKGQVSNMANEKLKFVCDYMEGAHPLIMKELLSTNMMQTSGYGLDEFSESARDKIRKACGAPNGGRLFPRGRHPDERHRNRCAAPLLSGRSLRRRPDTSQSMKPVPSNSADIKVLPLPNTDGKINAAQISAYMDTFLSDESHEHMVMPGMVYISQPTGIRNPVFPKELTALNEACRRYHLPLYVDGARLAYALASRIIT